MGSKGRLSARRTPPTVSKVKYTGRAKAGQEPRWTGMAVSRLGWAELETQTSDGPM